VIPWRNFSVHLSKRQIPQLAAKLRAISSPEQDAMHAVLRRYKRGFVWWRPDGLAYEFTLAALGERVAALGLERFRTARRAARPPLAPDGAS